MGSRLIAGGQNLVCFPVKTLLSARPPIPDLSLDDAVIFKEIQTVRLCAFVKKNERFVEHEVERFLQKERHHNSSKIIEYQNDKWRKIVQYYSV